jgi:DNA primase
MIKRIRIIELKSVIESAGVELKKAGSRYIGLCPFHREKTPSFFIFDNRRFKCFGCDENGDVIDFVQKYYNLSFKDALQHLGIEQSKITPKIHQQINHQKRKSDAIKRFEKWKGQYLAHLGMLINRTEKLMKNIPPEDLFWYAPLIDALPIWKYHSDLLLNGNDRAKFELYKEACRFE